MIEKLKTIGRQVLVLDTSEENCRNGEGAFIRLKDGGILFAYTEFLRGIGRDEDESQISGVVSYDEGETWSEKRVLVAKRPEALNMMCVNLLRLNDGSLAMIHGEKRLNKNQIITNKRFMRISTDEGKTWSEGKQCYDLEGYACMNHDRAIRLTSGRIILPIAHCSMIGLDLKTRSVGPGVVVFSVSDDDGKTWRTLDCRVQSPFSDGVQLQEPGLYQHADGTLWLWCRTGYGSQYVAFSKDDGETWSDLQPSDFFTSPASPMSVKRTGDFTVAVFNPIPEFCGRDKTLGPMGRTPLLCAVSTDDGVFHDGRSFERLFYLENDLHNSYCYCAIFPGKDYFLAAYYHSNGYRHCLKCTKIKKIEYKELEA